MKFNFFKKIWGRKEPERKEEELVEEKREEIQKETLKEGVGFQVLPLITEKTLNLSQRGFFTFLVDNKLNKPQIKQAIEKMFKVNVVNIRTMNYKKRIRGRTRLKSVRPKFKKAIVKLKEGQRIPIFE
jgi:large subunit ribosomal protein L23